MPVFVLPVPETLRHTTDLYHLTREAALAAAAELANKRAAHTATT